VACREGTTCSRPWLALAAVGSVAGLLLDPLSLLVRSQPCRYCRALNYALRAGHRRGAASGRSGQRAPWSTATARRARGRRCSASSSPISARHWASGACSLLVLFLNSVGPPLWCRASAPSAPCSESARDGRWSSFGSTRSAADDCRRCLLPLPGWRRPAPRRVMAQGRVSPLHELRQRLPTAGNHRSPRSTRARFFDA